MLLYGAVAAFPVHGKLGRVLRAFRRVAVGFAVVAAPAASSCTLGDAPSNCVPGQKTECHGDNGCTGHQTCQDDGYRYQECICDKQNTVPPFNIEAGADGRLPNLLGAPCVTDADCGPLLFCLTSASKTIFDEGPANGLCVADCAKDEA